MFLAPDARMLFPLATKKACQRRNSNHSSLQIIHVLWAPATAFFMESTPNFVLSFTLACTLIFTHRHACHDVEKKSTSPALVR
jgi:hypothetical protein